MVGKGLIHRWPGHPHRNWLGLSLGAIVFGWGVVALRGVSIPPIPPSDPQTLASPRIDTVTALGRLEPQGAVVNLSAPISSAGSRVDELRVEIGDRVEQNQVVAVLDSYDRHRAAVEEARQQVKLAQAHLAVVQSGAKTGEILAQQAEIERLDAQQRGEIEAQTATLARLQSELANARMERDRYQALFAEGAVSASQRDSQQLRYNTAEAAVREAAATLDRLRRTQSPTLAEAQANLARIEEVRPIDVQVAQAEVDRTIAALHQAEVSLEETLIRSPQAGEVLEIHTRAGETIAAEGIVEIGQTQAMQAIAEVYETDIHRVAVGQTARITSAVLPSELRGTVAQIVPKVRRQGIVNTDPSANIDARVVEVYVTLNPDDRPLAASLTNLQVQVVIEQ